ITMCLSLLYSYNFFFFQAEDGIRDKLVTGVQTCALPIWDGNCRAGRPRLRRGGLSLPRGSRFGPGAVDPLVARRPPVPARSRRRSEERRVGKEWRSRGGGLH